MGDKPDAPARRSSPTRPPRRPWHAVTGLDDFAIVTWACAPERLAAILPDGFEPEVFDGGDALGATALVSAVSFVDRDFRFRVAPFARMSCGQINHRAYVRHRGETGVWFAGTSLDHRLVAVARVLWSMPWHRESIALDATWDDGRCTTMQVRATGPWGALVVDLEGASPVADPPVLRSPLVTDPLVGWYPRRDGRVGRYSVWHEPLALDPMRVTAATAAPFVDLGVLDPGQPPIGALITRSTDFDVHTPPRRLR